METDRKEFASLHSYGPVVGTRTMIVGGRWLEGNTGEARIQILAETIPGLEAYLSAPWPELDSSDVLLRLTGAGAMGVLVSRKAVQDSCDYYFVRVFAEGESFSDYSRLRWEILSPGLGYSSVHEDEAIMSPAGVRVPVLQRPSRPPQRDLPGDPADVMESDTEPRTE